MRLIGSTLSPFVRKIRVAAIELGIGDAVELVAIDVFDPANGLERINPLRKIPALVLDDGTALYDSAVICEWLCARYPEPALLPRDGARWPVLVTQALADGLVDAAALARQEKLRPADEQSPAFIDKQLKSVDRALAALDADADWRSRDIDIAQIAAACALDWLSFRFPEYGWRTALPGLSAWHDEISRRPSMLATRRQEAT